MPHIRNMNNEKFHIAHRKWLDNETSVDEPLYTFPNDKTDIPGHLNMVRYYVGQLTKELPESIREAWLQWAEAAALWHDLGKFSEEFQRHICPVSYTHLRAHETRHDLVCRLLLEKKKKCQRV